MASLVVGYCRIRLGLVGPQRGFWLGRCSVLESALYRITLHLTHGASFGASVKSRGKYSISNGFSAFIIIHSTLHQCRTLFCSSTGLQAHDGRSEEYQPLCL